MNLHQGSVLVNWPRDPAQVKARGPETLLDRGGHGVLVRGDRGLGVMVKHVLEPIVAILRPRGSAGQLVLTGEEADYVVFLISFGKKS